MLPLHTQIYSVNILTVSDHLPPRVLCLRMDVGQGFRERWLVCADFHLRYGSAPVHFLSSLRLPAVSGAESQYMLRIFHQFPQIFPQKSFFCSLIYLAWTKGDAVQRCPHCSLRCCYVWSVSVTRICSETRPYVQKAPSVAKGLTGAVHLLSFIHNFSNDSYFLHPTSRLVSCFLFLSFWSRYAALASSCRMSLHIKALLVPRLSLL